MEVIRRQSVPKSDGVKDCENLFGEVVGIGRRFKDCRFANYRLTSQAQADAIKQLENWVLSIKNGLDTNLVLAGYRGSGKTHLAVAIMFALKELGLRSELVPFQDLLFEIRSTYRSNAHQTEWQILQRLKECDLLILDDLDRASLSTSERRTLQTLMDMRFREQRPSVLVTPLESQFFCSMVGEAVLARLSVGALVWVECNWR